MTGTYASDSDAKDYIESFKNAHLDAMKNKNKVYLSGTMPWRDKDYLEWKQVILPFERGGEVSETLTFLVFG